MPRLNAIFSWLRIFHQLTNYKLSVSNNGILCGYRIDSSFLLVMPLVAAGAINV